MKRLERALEVAMKTMVELAEGVFPENLLDSRLAEIDTILHPVEVVSEEVVRWECDCGNLFKAFIKVCPCCGDADKMLKRETTIRREKKVVERSVTVEANIQSGTGLGHPVPSPYTHANLFAAFPECHGKTGTLEFRWEE